MRLRRSLCLLPLLLAQPVPARETQLATAANEQSATAVVDSFHSALRRGDTAAAAALLTDDVLIFEAGGVERSKSEYAAHHLSADAQFSESVPAVIVRRSGGTTGELAWVASEGRSTGNFRGRSIDRLTAETMLLRRVRGGWRIAHIHWSSAAAPAAASAASGDSILTSSSPANGAEVKAPVNQLELSFSPPARLMELLINGPDGQRPMMVTAAGERAHYSLPLQGLGPGSYSVDWRASTSDGEKRGSFAFTIR